MGLQGNLEDLPLLDIVQIVSFSKKTGYLSIEMGGSDGAIVFHDGLVVAAFTPGSPPLDPRMASLAPDQRSRAIRGRIAHALEHLARLHEGAFSFELSERVPVRVGTRELALETLSPGINPQELLLELAQGIDEDRAHSAAAVEASFAAPEEGLVEVDEEPVSVVEVDLAEAAESGIVERSAAPPAPARKERVGSDTLAPAPPPAAPAAKAPGPGAVRAPAGARPEPARAAPEPARTAATQVEPAEPSRIVIRAAAPTPGVPVAAPADAVRTLLVADDEADVLDILVRKFSAGGYRVEPAGDPEQAVKSALRLREAGVPFVLVTDLGMPATGGASFHGGFEVVKRLWKMNLRPPVLMMTDSLSPALRLRAKQMGVKAFVFKPTLSKLNQRQFEADLDAFAARLVADVLPRLAEAAALRPAAAQASGPRTAPAPAAAPPVAGAFEFLKRRLLELRQGGDANQIATLVMKVAREFFERAVLMVVKNDEARGLGGFGLAPRDETLNMAARQIAIPLREPSLFRDVAMSCRPWSGPLPEDRWCGHLMARIGRFQSRDVTVLPLVAHRETIALLVGDNPESGRALERLGALEVFVEQAGIALENVFLQRKLQTIEERERTALR